MERKAGTHEILKELAARFMHQVTKNLEAAEFFVEA